MNEEQLADALAKHLEALLAGESLDEAPPEEIAQLLALAEDLESLVPQPRPDFGAALKESLLKLPPGANGSAPAAGGSFPCGPLALLVVVLGTVTTLLLIAGGVAWQTLRADNSGSPSPSAPVEIVTSQPVPTTETASPPPTATAIPTSTQAPDPSPTYTPVPVSPTFTPVIDVLPAITITVETAQELPLPPALAPGSAGSGSSDNDDDSSSGGGSGGGNGGGNGGGGNDDDDDGNRGHGNDSDGHDEDNPGHGRD
jgi:hypothetical protein